MLKKPKILIEMYAGLEIYEHVIKVSILKVSNVPI